MTYTQTITTTYTRVDIRRVFESVEATLRMAVTRTGLNTAQWATQTAHDLQHLAESAALVRAHLILRDHRDAELRALVLEPDDAASGWVDERPKANDWPLQPAGRLQIVIEHPASFYALAQARQADIMAGCILSWTATSIDLSHSELSLVRAQHFASNGYGVRARDFGR
jgi:D-alanyl-D-alanine dipeptidase